jgi:aspartate carbamoyltransferase regulatory subunit
MLNVDAIQNGIVIDHITEGKGLLVFEMLQLKDRKSISVAVLQSVRSQKYKRKDMIKIEGRTDISSFDILGYLDPQITLIVIQGGVVVKKLEPEPPKRLVNVIRCANPRCISSIEAECSQIFELAASRKYRCKYCDQEFSSTITLNNFGVTEL